MGRSSDWSPVGMESDPTPGDPDRIQELAGKLQDFSDDVAEALDKVRSLSGEEGLAEFVGQTADALTERVDDVPPNLEKLRDSYDLAAQALSQYWPKLADAQVDADRALADAETAQDELASAQAILNTATSSLTDAQQAVEEPDEDEVRSEVRRALDDAQTEHDSAQSAVDNAQARLDAARLLAQQAKEAREDAARLCVQGLEEASDAGMQNKRWWEKAVDWVVDNWDTIVQVAQVIGTVVGIIALFVGGPLVFGILAVVAIIALADALIKYANGQGSLWDVGFALLDVIPGARLIGKGASLARTGLRSAARNVDTGPALRQRSRVTDGRSLCGDPVDAATGEVVMPAKDVDLPGVLPLVLERHHISSYGFGRWFGRSWSSTLDQRLILDKAGARFFSADGMVLDYPAPLPDPEHPVMPVEGPRWGLAWDGQPGGTMTIHQPATGHTLHFAPVPGLPGAELPLVAVTDRNTNRIDIRYDEETGTPCEVAHSGGYRIGVATYENRITALHLISDPEEPLLLAYEYDDAGNLAEVYNSSGLPLRFEYDEHARLIRWEDRNNTWYRYEYDTDGRCVFSTGTDRALEYSYIYDTEKRRTTATNSLGQSTVYQFNEGFQLISETDPLGNVTTYELDRYDRISSITDSLGHTTQYTYDEQGNPTAVIRPDGRRSLAENGEHGLPVTVTQPDGHVWNMEYDSRGNLIAETDPTGARVSYQYDEIGATSAITDAAGRTVRLVNDAAGMTTAAIDAEGSTTRCERDAFGRVISLTDPTGADTRFEWTTEGKLSKRTLPDGRTEQKRYDGEGNLVEHIDPTGNVTRFEYGAFDRPTARTNPDGSRLEFAYDTALRVVSVTNELGATWRYVYDATGRLEGETDFFGREQTYRHDAAGRLVEQINGAGQSTVYVRDQFGKVLEKRTPGDVTTFVYDPVGNLLHARSAHAELVYERDALGRILSETCNGATVRSQYDVLGRRTRRITPSNAESVWEYDGHDRPVLLRTAGRTVTFGYDAAGRETQRRAGAAVLTQEWDANNRLSSQSLTAHDPSGALDPRRIQHRAYRYRPDGTVGAINDLLRGDQVINVDRTGRVTGIQAQTWTERYAYDAAGNLTQGEWQENQPAGSERVRHSGDVHYEYDAQGRVVVRRKKRLSRKPDIWRYTWDSQDRLTEVVTPDGTRWTYRYDPFGRRIAKVRFGPDGETVAEQVLFFWDGFVLAEQHTLSNDGTSECTVWDWERDRFSPVTQVHRVAAQDQPQKWIDEQFYSIVTDLVGTPSEMVDDQGNLAWHARTTVWGAGRGDRGSDRAYCPLRLPGQYHDPETGLHYNYQRHYDPETGQYASLDPLGLAPGPNPRAYVTNPFTAVDPLGLAPDCERALQAARDRANLEQARPGANKHTRPTSAAGLSVPGHPQTFNGASIKGGGDHNLHPDVQAAYDRVPPDQRAPGNQHGRCGEAEALSNAMNAGVDPRGGTMAAVNVRAEGNPAHGTPKPPCSSCQHVLDQFGITAVT